jgi:PAS domain S-box-containing protein
MDAAEGFIEIFNVVANTATVFGIVVAIYVLIHVRRIVQLLQTVIAPKTGIEGYLNMCAQVVEADPDGTCVVDDRGHMVLVNKRLEDICGYHRSELIGHSVEMLVPESMRNTHAAYREGFTVKPASRPMRGLLLRHKRGLELPVSIRLNRYVDPAGGFTIAKVRVPEE